MSDDIARAKNEYKIMHTALCSMRRMHDLLYRMRNDVPPGWQEDLKHRLQADKQPLKDLEAAVAVRGGWNGVRPLSVVVGVVEKDGKVLIAKRRADQEHPNEWEFPGGKIEPEDAPDTRFYSSLRRKHLNPQADDPSWHLGNALRRELQEELGIDTLKGETLIKFESRRGPDTDIYVFVITEWKGEPRGAEGQEIKWVDPESVTEYDRSPNVDPIIEEYMYRQAAKRDIHMKPYVDQFVLDSFIPRALPKPYNWPN